MQHGHKCTSIAVCVPTYLQYLWHIAHSLGALNIKATLPSNGTFSSTLQAAADVLKTHRSSWESTGIPQISAFVNATGLSALNIVPDEDMYPSRGQTVTVAGEANQITTIDGPASADASADAPITYVIPRPHSRTTILGGTRQIGRWDGEPEPATTAEILQEAKKWAPELLDANGEFRVLSVQVGLRPGRKGGARVEMEKVGEFVVCHAYGYGGAGYQNSVGAANKVVRLLGQWFGTEQ
jgi:glycine/D-amino acid oxidase-like deaminating enzyme